MTALTSRLQGSSKRGWVMGLLFIGLALLGVGLFVTGALWSRSQATAAPGAALVEPKAGAWKTWVIASGNAARLPAPPDKAATAQEIQQLQALVAQRDAKAVETIEYWNTGAPSYRWNQLLIQHLLKRNLTIMPAARHLALLNVALSDAMTAAWDTKYAYSRPRPSEVDPRLTTVIPNPHSPAYPSEYAVAAGAAQAILSYIFPDDAALFAAKAEEAARSRLLAGVDYPSDVSAGLDLGKSVAQRVIERAKTDGFDAQWTGSVPTGPGVWNGTNPILPQAANWKPWVLSTSSEFRPGPPPAYDSPEKAKEMDELRTFQRTPKTNADAFFWEYGAGGQRSFKYWNEQASQRLFEYGLAANPPRAARAYAVLQVALYDSMVACWDGKYTYWTMRPFQLDPNFKPLFTTPNHPSYPAAHGCGSTAAATALGYLFPRDAAELKALADEAADSRMWGGIHFRSDVVAGKELGRQVAEKVIARAKSDGE